MKFLRNLKILNSIERSSRVNLLLCLNDGFSILLEGTFSVEFEKRNILSSDEYIQTDFSETYLGRLKVALENQSIRSVTLNEETAGLTLDLKNHIRLNIFHAGPDISAWELRQNNKNLISSELGALVVYQSSQ